MTDQPLTPLRRITHELMEDSSGSFEAVVEAAEPGVVAATAYAKPPLHSEPMGHWETLVRDGAHLAAGTPILRVTGTATELMLASDHALGTLGFAGGIAARALQVRESFPEPLAIVCGGWKKLPVALKPPLRAALDVAGLGHRLVDGPFVYVDKNAVILLGGIRPAIDRARQLDHGPVSVQVTDLRETREAAQGGADIVMVDTGSIDDLRAADRTLRQLGNRDRTTLAFAGGVAVDQGEEIHEAGADIVDIGRAVLDAPLWDLRFRIV